MLAARKHWAAAFTALTVLLTMPALTASAETTMAPTDTGVTTAAPTSTTTAAPAATASPVSVPANLYSVEVAGGKVYFAKNGARVGSYSASATDLTLAINSNGNFLVSFPNSKGTTSSITLGDQRSLVISGTANSVTAHSSLGGSVALTTDVGSNISTMTLNAPVEAHIYGTVGTVNAQASADVIVERGASVTRARMVSANSLLTANGTVKTVEKNAKAQVKGSGVVQTAALTTGSSASGTSIARSKSGLIIDSNGVPLLGSSASRTTSTSSSGLRNSSSGLRNSSSSSSKTTTSTSGNLRLTASTIYADYRDELRSLESKLRNAVRAYDRDSGKRVYGDVYWEDDPKKEVKSTGTYKFAFEADGNDYGDVTGRIRIVVDDDDYDDDDDDNRGSRSYKFEIDDDVDIGIAWEDRRDYKLEDAMNEDDISDYVTAIDKSTDKEIDGKFEWVSPRQTPGRSATFRFRPDSSRYAVKTGTIRFDYD